MLTEVAGFGAAFTPSCVSYRRHAYPTKKPRLRAGALDWGTLLPDRRSQLPVLLENRAARAADAPGVSGQRRATAQQIAPGHAASAVAKPRGSGFAWRKFGEIDGAGAGRPNAHKNAHKKAR